MTECRDEGYCAERNALPAAKPSSGSKLQPDQILAALEQAKHAFLWADTFFGKHGCYVLVDKRSLTCEIKIAAEAGRKVRWLVERRFNSLLFYKDPEDYDGAR